jgi:hypothetical protein
MKIRGKLAFPNLQIRTFKYEQYKQFQSYKSFASSCFKLAKGLFILAREGVNLGARKFKPVLYTIQSLQD